jgi:hypothetical protein
MALCLALRGEYEFFDSSANFFDIRNALVDTKDIGSPARTKIQSHAAA